MLPIAQHSQPKDTNAIRNQESLLLPCTSKHAMLQRSLKMRHRIEEAAEVHLLKQVGFLYSTQLCKDG